MKNQPASFFEQDKWKEEFYSRYSSLFGRNITASTYEHYKPYGKHIVRKLFPSNKEARILDVGCGIGGFLKVFLQQGYKNSEGIDVSNEDVAYAHAHGVHQVKQGELWEVLKNTNDGYYDVVLYLDVLEHFRHGDVLAILKETERILAPNGRVIIHVPNAEGIFGSRIRYSDFTHEMAFTFHSLSQICRYVGFSSFHFFEDKPIIHGSVSFFRRIMWEMMVFYFRLLFAAETGHFTAILSQNILFSATKSIPGKKA